MLMENTLKNINLCTDIVNKSFLKNIYFMTFETHHVCIYIYVYIYIYIYKVGQ